jgi:uncharacterized protein YndB with AHSA1/START domain
MSAPEDNANVLVVRRVMAVPRERVFAAWLDPASLALWMRPEGITNAEVEVDPVVGGKFRIVMMNERLNYQHTGEYLAIEPPSRLSFTWISAATDLTPTVVTVDFLEQDRGTELVLTHRRLPVSSIDSHRAGWTEIVHVLAALLTAGQRSD